MCDGRCLGETEISLPLSQPSPGPGARVDTDREWKGLGMSCIYLPELFLGQRLGSP